MFALTTRRSGLTEPGQESTAYCSVGITLAPTSTMISGTKLPELSLIRRPSGFFGIHCLVPQKQPSIGYRTSNAYLVYLLRVQSTKSGASSC